MCRKCFNRSAIIIASIFAGTAVPPEGAETRHEGDVTAPWDGKVIDAFKVLVADVGQAAVVPGEGIDVHLPNFGSIMETLDASELLSLAGLFKATQMHFGTLAKLASREMAERVRSGDEDAKRIMGVMQEPVAAALGNAVLTMLKALDGTVIASGPEVTDPLDLRKMAEEAAGQKTGAHLN